VARRVVSRLAAAVCAAVLLLCAGCGLGLGSATSTPKQAAERLAQDVDMASSAVGTAELAVRQLRGSRTFPTVAEITLKECGGLLSGASAGLTRYIPIDRRDARWRDDALRATAQAQAAVADSRAWVDGGGGSGAGVQAGLADASDALDAVSGTLEKAGAQ
jgi:hypothetical protein